VAPDLARSAGAWYAVTDLQVRQSIPTAFRCGFLTYSDDITPLRAA